MKARSRTVSKTGAPNEAHGFQVQVMLCFGRWTMNSIRRTGRLVVSFSHTRQVTSRSAL